MQVRTGCELGRANTVRGLIPLFQRRLFVHITEPIESHSALEPSLYKCWTFNFGNTKERARIGTLPYLESMNLRWIAGRLRPRLWTGHPSSPAWGTN